MTRSETTADRDAPDFVVLLGPDFSGKSSALARLRFGRARCRIVSTDHEFVDARHALVSDLRRGVGELLPLLGGAYTPDFLAALLQTAVIHVRDELLRRDSAGHALVDSYYYKILAKCRLAGVWDNPMFAWWRSFPQPRRVVYLDVSTASAWRRCQAGHSLNPLEYYGERPNWAGFQRYQEDLAKLMREEIHHLPVTTVAERDDPAHTALAIQEVLDDEFR